MTKETFDVGSCVRPMPGQVHSGDFAVAVQGHAQSVIVLVDVAGHGHAAFTTGRPVARRLAELANEQACSPTSLVMAAHNLLQETQGAAVGAVIARIGQAVFAGVGNVRCLHVAMGSQRQTACQHLASRDGLVGVRLRTPREREISFSPGDLIVMHSDGVGSSLGDWSVSAMYAGNATSIARAIVECYGRETDDASCMVIRYRPPAVDRQ